MLAFDDNETGDGLPESQLMLQATVCSSMWLKVYHAAMCQSGGQQALAVNSCQHACSGSAQRLNSACRPIGGINTSEHPLRGVTKDVDEV